VDNAGASVGERAARKEKASISTRRTAPRPFSAESGPAVSEEREFRVRPGKAKRSKAQGRNARGLVAEVLRVAARAAAASAGLGRIAPARPIELRPGRTAFARSRLFGSGRRVLVKALPVRHRIGGRRMAPLSAHIAYLKREGVTRDGSPTRMFDAEATAPTIAPSPIGARTTGIISASSYRPRMRRADGPSRIHPRPRAPDGGDLGTRLDWVAVDHWNTDNPHVHLLVRGQTDQGADLVMARDYISHGLRSRAEELAFAELGPKPEHEISARSTAR
jgi:hypothetical protein